MYCKTFNNAITIIVHTSYIVSNGNSQSLSIIVTTASPGVPKCTNIRVLLLLIVSLNVSLASNMLSLFIEILTGAMVTPRSKRTLCSGDSAEP